VVVLWYFVSWKGAKRCSGGRVGFVDVVKVQDSSVLLYVGYMMNAWRTVTEV